MNKNKLTPKEKPVTSLEIEKRQQEYPNLFIPREVVDLILHCNVAIPDQKMLNTPDGSIEVTYFLGISDNCVYDYFWVNDVYSGRIPSNMVVIAVDIGGDNICYDTESHNLYYWNHEFNELDENGDGEPCLLLINGLKNFIDSLTTFDVPTIESNDFKVIWTSPDFDKLIKTKDNSL